MSAAVASPAARAAAVSSHHLHLSASRPLRRGMIEAFEGAISAVQSAAAAATQAPVEAVHEYRKSIRRARAVVALLRPAVGKQGAAGLRRELRDAARPTGRLRDVDVLLETLKRLPLSREAAAARKVLEREADRRPDAEKTAGVLRGGAARLRKLSPVLSVLLEKGYGGRRLRAGLVRLDRRARKALDRVKKSGGRDDFHSWRKRVKELRYAIELLASAGGASLERRERRLAHLARDLGNVTDFFVLRRELVRRRNRRELADVAPLFEAIDRTVEPRVRKLIRRGREVFSERPERFARAILSELG